MTDASPRGPAATLSNGRTDPPFPYFRDDIEARLGLSPGRFTSVNNLAWLIAGLALTVVFYGVLGLLPTSAATQMFTDRGAVQYAEVFFSFWAVAILAAKWAKIRIQYRALGFRNLVPANPEFVLSPATVGEVLGRLRESCEDPSRFLLFNRIETALSNLKNMGRIGDVDDVLQSQAANDADTVDSSYALVRGLIWAIPVLGFIGTVQGLSQAIGSFGSVLTSASDLEELKPALQGVTAGLATAFETTLVALVAALAIQLILTWLRKSEDELLEGCTEYCQRNIVGRLRLLPFDRSE